MRNRIRLIEYYGAKTLSPKGMALVPWRKGKQSDLHPGGFSPNAHTARGDHSGNIPPGKQTKGHRVKAGPPGSPNGVCTKVTATCKCGKHYKDFISTIHH